jgi:hypothetical protein
MGCGIIPGIGGAANLCNYTRSIFQLELRTILN